MAFDKSNWTMEATAGVVGANPLGVQNLEGPALNFVESLRDDWYSIAGEREARVTGGRRQCLAIVRALVRDARILLLNEATRSSGPGLQGFVKVALDPFMKGRTTLVVAHGLSAIRQTHRTVCLQNAKVVEVGDRKELRAGECRYAHLHEIQLMPTL